MQSNILNEQFKIKINNMNIGDIKNIVASPVYDQYGDIKYNKQGQPVKTIKADTPTFMKILDLDKRYAGKIKYNDFSQMIEFNDANIIDMDESTIIVELETDYNIYNEKKLRHAINDTAKKYRYNPMVELLESFKWDGIHRINTLFTDTLGAEKTEYNANVAKLMLLGAINRIYNPGCKFDYCVILASKNTQGLGKSSLVRKLALKDKYFTDSLNTMDTDTNTLQRLRGKWFVELGELKTLNRCKHGVEGVKNFISSQSDFYRDSYQKHSRDFPRTCIFVGTTNRDEYLMDDTGNRRFLPVMCATNNNPDSLKRIKYHMYEDTKEIKDYVIQLWAEAMTIFKSGNYSIALDKDTEKQAEKLCKEARVYNPNVDLIQDYINNTTDSFIGINSIYMNVFNDGVRKVCPTKERNEIKAILNSLDITGITPIKKPVRTAYGTERGWKVIHDFKPLPQELEQQFEQQNFLK